MGLKIILAVILGVINSQDISAQNLCQFTTKRNPLSNETFVESFSTGKCFRVEAFGLPKNAKVILDDCSYWKNSNIPDQKFSLVSSPLGKTLLRTVTTNGDSICLTTKNGILQTSLCQSSNFDHNWTLKHLRDNGNQFIIEQYSSKKCLIPKSRERGSVIKLLPCNSLQTEQIWKICTK